MSGTRLAVGLLGLVSVCLTARLPDSGVKPTAYDVYIEPRVTNSSCTFRGKTDIRLKVHNYTNEIVLHSRHLKVDESKITLEPLTESQPNEVNNIETNQISSDNEGNNAQNITLSYGEGESKQIIRVLFSHPLEPGSEHKLHFEYNGTLKEGISNGLYCRKCKRNETKWYVSTTFEPYLARSAFPCFDEPSYKANFTIRVAHPNGYKALSNMPAASVTPLEGEEDWSVTEFETTPPLSSYLVAFFVGPFKSREVKLPDQRTLRVWASSEEKLEMADLALAYSKRHYQFLANYTSIPDPLPKIDLLAIKHYHAGGLENWGLISLEERLVLLDSRARSKKANLLRASSLLAHELAHIWFGNLVTPAYWDDIWLSEGFASYFATLATTALYPNYGYDVQAWVLARLAAMSADSLPTAHPLKVPVDNHPTGDLFDEIAYQKGELMVRMLSLTLGEEALQRSISRYLEERKFGTASESRLWAILEEEVDPEILPENVTLAEIMRTWVEQPGYPLVTVRRNYATSEVTISQRSIIDGEGEAGGWWIPITYTCAGEREYSSRPKFWLSPYSGPIVLNISIPKDDWLLFNLRGSGYYTVKYDDRNSLLLVSDIDSIPVYERMQVYGDILDLGQFDYGSIEVTLDVMLQFKFEESPFPWFLFLSAVPKFGTLLKGTPIESSFKDLTYGMLEKEMAKLTKDSPHRKQVIKLACKMDVKNCTDMALEMFEEWKKNSTKLSPEELHQYTVFCTAIAKGTKETWEYMAEKYHSSDNRKEKKDILKALACTTDKELKDRYVAWALERNKTKCDKKVGTMLKALADNDPSLVLNTINNHHPIPSKIGKNMRWKKVLEHVAQHVNNEQQLQELKKIVELDKSNLKFAESRENSSRIFEIAERNIAWLKNNQEKAKKWFEKHVPSK